MAENEGQAVEVEETATQALTVEELQKQNEELQAKLQKELEEKEHIKKSQSGSDKTVVDLQTKIKELNTELETRLDEKELEERRVKQKEDELKALQDRIKQIEEGSKAEKINAFKIRKLSEYGLDAGLADVIDAQSEDQALLKIEKLKESVDKTKQEVLKKTVTQSTPQTGQEDGAQKKVRGSTVQETLSNL